MTNDKYKRQKYIESSCPKNLHQQIMNQAKDNHQIYCRQTKIDNLLLLLGLCEYCMYFVVQNVIFSFFALSNVVTLSESMTSSCLMFNLYLRYGV